MRGQHVYIAYGIGAGGYGGYAGYANGDGKFW
jgi:hypothetical protein